MSELRLRLNFLRNWGMELTCMYCGWVRQLGFGNAMPQGFFYLPVHLENSCDFPPHVAALREFQICESLGFQSWRGSASGLKMVTMVHKRPLSEQIAFPGVGTLL